MGQPVLAAFLLLEQLLAQPLGESLTAPGAAPVLSVIGHSVAVLLLLEQLLAQPLGESLTAPGAAPVLSVIGHWAAALLLLEQLEAQPEASPTAPGDADLQQESPVEQQELEVETAPRAALSSFFLLWSQAARTLRRAAAARVVRVRVMT